MKKLSWPLIIIIVFCALGLYQDITNAPIINFLIPLILIAGVILLIKFPPNRWSKSKKQTRAASEQEKYKQAVKIQRQKMKQNQQNNSSTSKTLPFKVIEGGRDDNDTPRYH